jgi:RNA polymerase sigma-70 factor (ECF subfamily)
MWMGRSLGKRPNLAKNLSAFPMRPVYAGETSARELMLNADVENELVRSCQKGDRGAYARLVQAHAGRVFAVCLGMLGNRHDAEDAAQQAFLRGFMKIRTIRQSGRFAAWIGQISRNVCVDLLRRRKREGVPTPAADRRASLDAEDERRLESALARLAPDYRVPLLLFYFDGRSTKNIAETLGISQAAVQTRLTRARKQLRGLLKAHGEEQ